MSGRGNANMVRRAGDGNDHLFGKRRPGSKEQAIAAARARRLELRDTVDRQALAEQLGGAVLTGDYRTVFCEREHGGREFMWDTLITDPPFGARTHRGARTSAAIPETSKRRHGIGYTHWTPGHVAEFVGWAAPRTRRWIAAMTSHDLCKAYEDAYLQVGWYPFAPIPVIVRGMGCRLQGDGPSNVTFYLMVARSRSREAMANPCSNRTALWRTLPGFYDVPRGRKPERPGKDGQGRDKPAELLKRIVAYYSNPGDLVCDPMAGYGSTLIAALAAGRRAIGSEIVPRVAKVANREIARAQIWRAALAKPFAPVVTVERAA